MFWCQIVRNAKIFSSSQHAAPCEVTGFSCYYLSLASDEPVLIWCNFTVFLGSGRGEGGLRMLLHCQDCTSVSILLPFHVCFWQVQILKGAESYWFCGNWKTRREKLGAEGVLAIWLADPAVLTGLEVFLDQRTGWWQPLTSSSTTALPSLLYSSSPQNDFCLKMEGREVMCKSLVLKKKKECCLGVLWFVTPAMSPCNKMEHLTWWRLEDP